MLNPITRSNRQQIISFCVICLIFNLVWVANGNSTYVVAQDSTDLTEVRVAVYTGGHSSENLASRTALIQMLDWMNAEITLISPEAMLNGTLAGHSLLVMPGISPYTLRDEMTTAGYDVIRNFIATGGAYIGIYGGTFFEWTHFELFDVELQNMLPDLPVAKSLVTINIHKNATGPDLSSLQDAFSILSWTGSYFDAPDMSQVTTIASYAQNGLPCMVTFKYGLGTVFLSSPHPEIEEGDSRDGTEFQDGLNDPESEWGLMQIIACWLVNVSGIVPTNPMPVIVFAAFGVLVIIVISLVAIFRRRRML